MCNFIKDDNTTYMSMKPKLYVIIVMEFTSPDRVRLGLGLA